MESLADITVIAAIFAITGALSAGSLVGQYLKHRHIERMYEQGFEKSTMPVRRYDERCQYTEGPDEAVYTSDEIVWRKTNS